MSRWRRKPSRSSRPAAPSAVDEAVVEPPQAHLQERRLSDQAVLEMAQAIAWSRRRSWAVDVAIARLSDRVAYTGEIVHRGLLLSGHYVPLVVLSPRGLFVLVPTADRAKAEDFQLANRGAHLLGEHLPAYQGAVRSAVVLADTDLSPQQFIGADGVSGGIQVGSQAVGQMIDLFDDAGPLRGDLQAIADWLAG